MLSDEERKRAAQLKVKVSKMFFEPSKCKLAVEVIIRLLLCSEKLKHRQSYEKILFLFLHTSFLTLL